MISGELRPPRITQYLKISLNSATVEAHCVMVDGNGVAVYAGEIVYRGDCVELDIDLLENRTVAASGNRLLSKAGLIRSWTRQAE